MEVFIARDGEVIAECQHQELEAHALAGEVLPTDHYWHDGMSEWGLLEDFLDPNAWAADESQPPPTATKFSALALAKRLLVPGAICLAFVLAGGLLIYFTNSNSPDAEKTAARALAAAAPTPRGAEADLQLRDKAAAELRQKIETLPARAAPPLNTFYYDVSVHMKKTFSHRTPWTATIKGGENVVDPGTESTLRRTEFILTADYENGTWLYKGYRASTTNLADFTTLEVQETEDTPTPPSIVGLLGLEMHGR